MPRSSATVHRRQNLTDLGNSLALGLQREVNSISLQCIPWPVACSEWGACLTDFRFQILGQMTPKVKIFKNVFTDSATWHQTRFHDQIWWKSAVAKSAKGRVVYQKNSGSGGPVPAPILPKMGRSCPKFLNAHHGLGQVARSGFLTGK